MSETRQIVEMIGPKNFEWLSREFNEETRLKDVPEAILDSAASVDIATRNYASQPNALRTIALITFAYKMAGKAQKAHYGAKDIVLLKVLAKSEKERRKGKSLTRHWMNFSMKRSRSYLDGRWF